MGGLAVTSIWTSRFYDKPGDPKFCRAAVYSREAGQIFAHSYQCQRKPVCTRVVQGEEYGFCKQHDPEEVKARSDARHEQWRLESKARDHQYERQKQEREAMEACKDAIEKIAAGHNDPTQLARAALAKFPEK